MSILIRFLARFMIALALCLVIISVLAGLAGCHVTRAFSTAEARAAMQQVDCSNWDECA